MRVVLDLCMLGGVRALDELLGRPLPGLGEFVGLTYDDEEGFIVWYLDACRSTRAVVWAEVRMAPAVGNTTPL